MIEFLFGLSLGVGLTLAAVNRKYLTLRYYRFRAEYALTKASEARAKGDTPEAEKQLAIKAKFDAKVIDVAAK